jgi:hypothetical protein
MCAFSLHAALRLTVEASIQLEHDLDANTSPRQSVAHRERAPEREEGAWGEDALRVHRCLIARCFARFACEGLKHCADFAHQRKSVQSVHARFLQTCTLGSSVHSAPDAHFFRESMH